MKERDFLFVQFLKKKQNVTKEKKNSNEIYIILQFSFFDSLKRRHV